MLVKNLQRTEKPEIKTIKEFAKLIGAVSPKSLYFKCRQRRIKIPDNLKPWKYDSRFDKLIESGYTLKEMGKKLGVSRELFRVYINGSGQYAKWRELRNNSKKQRKQNDLERKIEEDELKQSQKDLIITFKKITTSKAYEEDWASGKAHAYFYSRNKSKTNIPLENLFSLFKSYKEASEKGILLGLGELTEKSGISPIHISRILKEVGLEPMYGSHNRHVTSEKQKNMIRRGIELKMSSEDIAYFVNINPNTIRFKFRSPVSKNNKYFIFRNTPEQPRLSYRLASQIYEAKDAKFTREEICDFLDIKKETLEFVLSKRSKFEPEILNVLRIIYDRPKIRRPYKINDEK